MNVERWLTLDKSRSGRHDAGTYEQNVEVGRSGSNVGRSQDGPQRVERDVDLKDAGNGIPSSTIAFQKRTWDRKRPCLPGCQGEVRVGRVEAWLPNLHPCRFQGSRVVAVDRWPTPYVGNPCLAQPFSS